MALRSTVLKADLNLLDYDHNNFTQHSLTLAQHPSETEERLMIRLLAFVLYADERLQFGKGLSAEDEPSLFLNHDHGEIDLWIDVGLPDEKRLRKAASRSDRVVLLAYGARGSLQAWWDKTASACRKLDKLTVWQLPPEACDALPSLVERTMRLQCTIQDGAVELSNDAGVVVTLKPERLE